MVFLRTELVVMLVLVHQIIIMEVVETLLHLLEQTTFVNQARLHFQLSPFRMNAFGMEKGALSVEILAARSIPHRTLLHNYKHPPVIALKAAYVDIKIEIGREELAL